MKKIFVLFVLVFSFVGCIDSLVRSLTGLPHISIYTENANLIIENPKTFYNVGDTLKMRYVFPNSFIGEGEKGLRKENINIHRDFIEIEKDLFTFHYRGTTNVSTLIKDGNEVYEYSETLIYDESSNTYVSQPILLILKKEGNYVFKGDSFLFQVETNIVKTRGRKDFRSVQLFENHGNEQIEVRP